MASELIDDRFRYFETDDGYSYLHRRGEKVSWLGYGGGMWLVAGFDELSQVLEDDDTFSSSHDLPNTPSGRRGVLTPPTPIRAVPIEIDPPEYREYRKLLSPLFSPTVVRAMTGKITEYARWCLSRHTAAGRMDLFNDLIKLVPAMVTLDIIGLPREDGRLIADAIHRRGDDRFSLSPTWVLLFKHTSEAIQARRREPADDLISHLLSAAIDGERLTDTQITEICFTVIVGGMSTTAKLTLGALAYLGVNRGARDAIIADFSLLPGAMEEFLRYYSPVSILARTATRDACIAGQSIAAGDRVGLGFAAANRDPGIFRDPDTVDLRRSPNRHLAFGRGMHFCIGSNLGRAEASIMVQQVLRTIPDYELDGEFYLAEDVSSQAAWGKLRKVSWSERLERGLRVSFMPVEPPDTHFDLTFTTLPTADDILRQLAASRLPALHSAPSPGDSVTATMSAKRQMTVAELELSLQDDLQIVEDRLRACIRSDQTIISEMSGHLVVGGGKRLRPTLVLLCAQFGDPREPKVLTAAVICELTHVASLYHNDVMDEASVRRGVPSANQLWNNKLSILTGDYLFAQAARIGIGLGEEIGALYSSMAKRLISGQIRETVGPMAGQELMPHYLRVVADKTGALIASACKLGARVAQADEAVIEALGNFGEALGIAFQFADDILDIVGDTADLGKCTAQDLRANVPTLPVIHARAMAGSGDAELIELLDSPNLGVDPEATARALALLRQHPAIAAARRDLDAATARALAALAEVPDICARRKLADIARDIRTRTH